MQFINQLNTFHFCYVVGSTPFIYGPQSFVVVEKSVFTGPVDFREALIVMFAVYYVFNIAYPDSIAATLEFIQR